MEYAKSLQSSKPSGSDAIPLCKQNVLGVPVTVASLSDTLKMAEQAIRDRRPVRQVSINVAKYVAIRTDPGQQPTAGTCLNGNTALRLQEVG